MALQNENLSLIGICCRMSISSPIVIGFPFINLTCIRWTG
jgi:hypothetical protein